MICQEFQQGVFYDVKCHCVVALGEILGRILGSGSILIVHLGDCRLSVLECVHCF